MSRLCILTSYHSITTSDVYLVFSEYQIATTTASAGVCITEQGPQITLPLQSLYSVTRPLATDYAVLYYNATTSFIDYLGFSSCTPALVQVTNVTPVDTILKANPTSPALTSPLLSSTTLKSTASSPTTTGAVGIFPASGAPKRLTPKKEAGISVSAIVFGLAFIILGTWAWRRYRKQKTAAATAANTKDSSSHTEETQPYLQKKSELEAEEARKYELHAEQLRYELGDNTIHEMQSGDQTFTESRLAMPSLRATHELRAEEHSKELEASQT